MILVIEARPAGNKKRRNRREMSSLDIEDDEIREYAYLEEECSSARSACSFDTSWFVKCKILYVMAFFASALIDSRSMLCDPG